MELDDQLFVDLKQKYPKLTREDLRLCAYVILGLSSKEISSLLSIEAASVDRRRYRLRKKLGVSKGIKLAEFLLD